MKNNNDKNTSSKASSSHIRKKDTAKTSKLSGIEKAAILLVSMGSEVSSQILKQLNENEVEELVQEIAKIDKVDKELKKSVLKEFQNLTNRIAEESYGGEDVAKQMIEKSYGKEKADEMLKRFEETKKPLQKLNNKDPEKIAMVLQGEHPQTIAIVMASLSSKVSAQILSNLPEENRAEIIRRMSEIKQTNRYLLDTLEESLIKKLEELPDKAQKAGGVDAIVNILNSGISTQASKKILEDLEETDNDLAEEIKSRLVRFEDIIYLLDRDVQYILSQVDIETVGRALKLANEEVKNKILNNLSKRVYKEGIEPILSGKPIRVNEIEEAQSDIVKEMKKALDNGNIFFSDEYIQ
jgi:flagellar motor switch protein FliG